MLAMSNYDPGSWNAPGLIIFISVMLTVFILIGMAAVTKHRVEKHNYKPEPGFLRGLGKTAVTFTISYILTTVIGHILPYFIK